MIKLSICISTLNRAHFIAETLESLVPQLSHECEVIVSNNASIDETENVVKSYINRCDYIKYVRQDNDLGFDRNYDRTIELAEGRYIWLLADDDPPKSGAIGVVLEAISQNYSLILVNSEVRDVSLQRVLKERYYNLEVDRIYEPAEMDLLFRNMEPWLNFVSGYIIEASVWRGRERSRYYDSLFFYVGVVFQSPLPGRALVVSKPLINCRFGNSHTYWHKVFEVATIIWPKLVWSLGISESAKEATPKEPWRDFLTLLMWRGIGAYTLKEYRKLVKPRLPSQSSGLIPILVSVVPCSIANTVSIMCYTVSRRKPEQVIILKGSRYYVGNWIRRWTSLSSEGDRSRSVFSD